MKLYQHTTALFAVCTIVSGLPAQSVAPTNPVAQSVVRARALADMGSGSAARDLLDSLVSAQRPGTVELAEALYWRGALAESVAVAERDWIRVLFETPLADRASDALLRLSELETIRGRHDQALQYAERALRDHASSINRPYALLWASRSALASGKAERGCGLLVELRSAIPEGALELRAQANDLNSRCASLTAPAASSAQVAGRAGNAAGEARSAERGRFSVQLAAYNRMRDAEGLVKRLAARGITARVDGAVAPFRVRTGYYSTKEEAAAALADLKRKGHDGFVAEITP